MFNLAIHCITALGIKSLISIQYKSILTSENATDRELLVLQKLTGSLEVQNSNPIKGTLESKEGTLETVHGALEFSKILSILGCFFKKM